jgi:DNA helicase-2/ATP-dependent DNA helicase PcrA
LISIKDNNDNFPVITSCNTSTGEVINIVEQIQNLYNKKLIEKYNQTAVLIRAGYQAKKIVNIFNKKHLPYIEVGIINLYQRKEIKDLIFYIKLIYNKDDNFAFKQIINIPPRGIGDKTLEKIIKNNTNNLSYFQCAEDFIKTKKNSKIANFLKFIKELNEEYIENDCTININEIQKPTIKDLLKKIIQNVNYIDFLKKKYKGEMANSRIENINNLLSSVENQICNKENITEFLEYASLECKEENEEKKTDNKVIISTIHKAKGLEYDYVFLPFWNNNSFPNLKTLQEKNGMEEERRLAYVAITRAKKNVYISYHIKNIFKDKIFDVYPSNFIEEISENKTNKINFVRIDDDINEERKIDIFQYLGEKRKRENNEFENNNNEFSLFSNIENDNFN